MSQPKEERSEGIAESNHALSALQELLRDTEFEQFDLEQLAESLLEDVSTNLETNVSSGIIENAKNAGSEQQLPQSLVGSDNARMESSKDISLVKDELIDDVIGPLLIDTDETYNKCNIIYGDDIPVDEECLEIQEDSSEVCLTSFKNEPVDGLLSPISSFYEENLKSPHKPNSDCGYESHGSPHSMQDFNFDEPKDDLNSFLNDLFPSLASSPPCSNQLYESSFFY